MSHKNREMVIIESPFSAPTQDKIIRNVYYAMLAVRDSLGRSEAPYASHLFYTQMLDDEVPDERMLGIAAGLDIGKFATRTAVYLDLGVSRGMQYGVDAAMQAGRPVQGRYLFDSGDECVVDAAIYGEIKRHNLPSPDAVRDMYARIIT